ncbi:DUF3618 domain-containing protein [Mycolicibacterium sp.]|jgi:hypothetical protein|uniref:DUF3618 domain-containing protein n=1 Tax=Mycolicibacterium sp. TaxID=2320850 RepID=UPI0028ACCF77|nr:DUF3618 domain-containing protein [Mycolicibacterium sp.]
MPGTSHARDGRHEAGTGGDTSAIEADIEQTRRELGETAEALAAKLDVSGQVHAKVDETKQRVAEKAEPVRRNAAPIAAVAGVMVLLLLLRRRRSRRRQAQWELMSPNGSAAR